MKVRGNTASKTTFLLGAVLLPLAAVSQSDKLQLDLNRCAAIADINSRVACYDGLARPQPEKPQGKAPQAAVGAATSGPPQARSEPREQREEAILEKVTSLKEVEPDKLRITLANGQVWQQTVGKAFLIRTNDTVRIAASSWGRSFRLTVDGHPEYIQVTRLQ